MTSSETATATDFLILGQNDAPGPHRVEREGLVTVVLKESGSISWKYDGKLELLSDTTLRGRDMPGAPSAHAWLIAAGEPERTQLVFIMNDNPEETLTFEINVV